MDFTEKQKTLKYGFIVYGKCSYSERNDINTAINFCISKIKEKKISLNPELIAVHLNGRGAQYHWAMSTSGAECEKNKHLISINYKTSDNSAGLSLYKSFLLFNFLVL